MNITTQLLDRHLDAGLADKVAVESDAGRWTYQDLHANACRFGSALLARGLCGGDRVAILLADCREWIAAFLGAIRVGAIPVPLNTLLPPTDYVFFLEHSGARVLVTSGDQLDRLGALVDGFPQLQTVVVGDECDADSRSPAVAYERFLEGGTSSVSPAATGPDDPAFWLYSSGTTGQPKGVVHRHASMAFSAENYAQHVLGAGADDSFFSAAKLFFAYGLGNSLYFPLWLGAKTILAVGRSVPEAVFHQIVAHRPTLFFGVPTLFASMLEEAESRACNIDSVRLSISAGEPLPAEIYHRWYDRFGGEILDGIGTTEMVHIFISNRGSSVRPGSTGTPVPGYQARIVDDEGVSVPVGTIGNLLVCGRSSLAEYWEQPEATAETVQDGWVRTGDKYSMDEDGHYWYAGRCDDMLKVSGNWVSPFEVEAALVEHPVVLESAVIGIEDGHQLVKPKAFVVLRSSGATAATVPVGGSDGLAAELKTFVKARLAPYKYPRWIEFVEELPKTATGKIQRYKLREHETASQHQPTPLSEQL